MTHAVGIEQDPGTVLAWVLTLPGCVTSASDERSLGTAIPLAIAEHTAWLCEHGQHVDVSAGWEVAQRVDGSAGDSIFEAETAPISDHELAALLERACFARLDMLQVVDGLPPAVLDWEPPREAFAHFDRWAPDVRSIADVVAHVLSFEAYYRGGLRDGPAAGITEVIPAPAAARERTAELLRALPIADRSRIFHPTCPGVAQPESWTVRKVLRRLISHERAHTFEILERRGWAFGGPRR